MADDVGADQPTDSGADEAMLEAVGANYPQVASELLLPLLEVFKATLEAGEGDIEKLLIMLVIAQRTADDPRFRGMRVDDLFTRDFPALAGNGLSANAIADALQISQETVRRKVVQLIKQGWLVRQGYDLSYTTKGFFELIPLRDKVIRMAVAHHRLIRSLKPHWERVSVGRPDAE